MRSFISQFNDKLLKRTDYILSRQYGVLSRTEYIDTTTTDSTQSQVNEESKYDDVRDKHGIYGAMIYDEHYQLDFPCYESCLLYKVTFQIIAPFDAGTKIGIFNEKAPIVILDITDADQAAPDHDFYTELNADVQSLASSYVEYTTDPVKGVVPIDSIYDAIVWTETGLPDTAEYAEGTLVHYLGDTYPTDHHAIARKGFYYKKVIEGLSQSWVPVNGFNSIGYECYTVKDPIDNVTRMVPRIVNVDPYETDQGVPIPINIHARIIGNESKSAFGYLTVETYPIERH